MEHLAGAAATTALFDIHLGEPQAEAVIRAGRALLLAATAIAVYKPCGVTRYGQRTRNARRPDPGQTEEL